MPEGLSWLDYQGRKSGAQLQHLLAKGGCWRWSFAFQEGSSTLPLTGRVCHKPRLHCNLGACPTCAASVAAQPTMHPLAWRPGGHPCLLFLHWPPRWCCKPTATSDVGLHPFSWKKGLSIPGLALIQSISSHRSHSKLSNQDPSIPGI